MKYFIALAFFAVASATSTSVPLTLEEQCDCGPVCPDGCCPNCGWECCPDIPYCAATLDDCPSVVKKIQLEKMAAPKQCDGDGIACPGGCCPYHGWLCCPDSMYCAPTLDDCPSVAKKIQLKKMATPKQCDMNECPAGTDGPGGCCPMVQWECCPDGLYCAPTLDDCPVNTKKTQLTKLAAPKQCDGDGPACPGGCCPILDGYCCPDGLYCAATADDCPFAQH